MTYPDPNSTTVPPNWSGHCDLHHQPLPCRACTSAPQPYIAPSPYVPPPPYAPGPPSFPGSYPVPPALDPWMFTPPCPRCGYPAPEAPQSEWNHEAFDDD